MALLPIEPDNRLSLVAGDEAGIKRFGDGYKQRIKVGINTNPQKWNVSYETKRAKILHPTDPLQDPPDETIDTMTAFLDGLGGVTSFEWIPPGERLQRKFIVVGRYRKEYPYGAQGAGYKIQTLSFDIEEVFE